VTVEKKVEELRYLYGAVSTKTLPNGTILVRIKEVQLPSGCAPSKTDFLIEFPQNQDVPSKRYVKENITLPNGKTPRNFTPTQVDGEPWYEFSFNFPWNSQTDPMYQYVESALQRFAKTE